MPIKEMLEGTYEVTGFFYNPNIHPEAEFRKRIEATKLLSSKMGIEVIFDEEYNPRPYFERLYGTNKKAIPKDIRCENCYALRLERTAVTARAFGYDAFSSSLLYSRYQKHDEVVAIGRELEKAVDVPFFNEDFRKGWHEGIKLSKEYGLYRQKYCGCVFSLHER